LGKIGKGKKWGFKLNNVVDVVGRYVQNGTGGAGGERRRREVRIAGEGGGLRVIVCLLPPSHKAMADKYRYAYLSAPTGGSC